LPVPAEPVMRADVPLVMPPPSSASSSFEPLLSTSFSREMGGRCRIDLDAACGDAKVVVTTTIARAAQLEYLEPSSFSPVVHCEVLERDDTVRDTLQLEVILQCRPIVEQQCGAIAAGEELLERENLAAEPKRIAREHPHLGQRVEHNASRLVFLHCAEDVLHSLLQLHLGRLEERVRIIVRREAVGTELEQLHVLQVPPVGRGGGGEFLTRLRERHVHGWLATVTPLQKELHGKRGLPGTGNAVDEVDAIARKAAAEYAVEAADSGGGQARRHGVGRFGGHSVFELIVHQMANLVP
jgi:hypothetical protein